MKTHVPILWPTRFTPALRPGLQLAAATHDGKGAWLHGALVLPEPGAGGVEAWLDSLCVAAISEQNQLPRLGKLVAMEGFLQPRAWEAVEVEKKPHFRACFSLWSRTRFELFADRFHLHAAAQKLLSPSIVLAPGAVAPLVAGKADLPGDTLLLAYDHALQGRFAESATAFAAALKTPAVAAELDSAHRYNAACAAAKAAAALRENKKEQARAAELLKSAQALLGEDLKARAEAHTRRSLMWATSQAGEEAAAAIDEVYRGHVRALRNDPDLAGLDLDAALKASLGQPG